MWYIIKTCYRIDFKITNIILVCNTKQHIKIFRNMFMLQNIIYETIVLKNNIAW